MIRTVATSLESRLENYISFQEAKIKKKRWQLFDWIWNGKAVQYECDTKSECVWYSSPLMFIY